MPNRIVRDLRECARWHERANKRRRRHAENAIECVFGVFVCVCVSAHRDDGDGDEKCLRRRRLTVPSSTHVFICYWIDLYFLELVGHSLEANVQQTPTPTHTHHPYRENDTTIWMRNTFTWASMQMRFDSVPGIDGAGFGCREEPNLQCVRHVRMGDDMWQKYNEFFGRIQTNHKILYDIISIFESFVLHFYFVVVDVVCMLYLREDNESETEWDDITVCYERVRTKWRMWRQNDCLPAIIIVELL